MLDDLVAAEDNLDLDGDRLVHHDVRSDNVCFRGDRVILVDWSDARRGHPRFDLANLLQGLPLEGGPDPYDVMPDGGPFAAWSPADHAHRAATQAATAPTWLIKILKRMALIDLDWATKCLDLPPRQGIDLHAV